MADFPFCVIGDVQAKTQDRTAYSASTQPTSTQVNDWMDEIAEHIRSVASEAGYDLDNLHEVSGTVSGSITAGSSKQLTLGSGEPANFTIGDLVLVCGYASGVRKWEFDLVTATDSTTITVATVDNNMDDSPDPVVYVLNGALTTLRDINALGVAAYAEQARHGGVGDRQSAHADKLMELYQGNDVNRYGLWAIKNVEGFLRGATITTEGMVKVTLQSYGSEHSTDSDVEPVIEKEMDF